MQNASWHLPRRNEVARTSRRRSQRLFPNNHHHHHRRTPRRPAASLLSLLSCFCSEIRACVENGQNVFIKEAVRGMALFTHLLRPSFSLLLLHQRPSSRTTENMWLHDKAPGVPSSVLNTTRRPTGAIIDTKLVVSNLHYNVTIKDLVVRSNFTSLGRTIL